jgi:putative DNA methylase
VPRPGDVPESEIPHNPRYLTAPNYGMRVWADLFTNRQLTALTTFSDLVTEAGVRATEHGGEPSYANDIVTYLGMAISRAADSDCVLATWKSYEDKLAHGFTRQAISMVWDYAEVNPIAGGAGDVSMSSRSIAKVLEALPQTKLTGQVRQGDAKRAAYTNVLVATDPPYYDNVGYADLSDFFYVWLRRSLGNVFPELTETVLTPKGDELVADPFRHSGKQAAERYFEDGFRRVFDRIREGTPDGYPLTVFYAFKQSETDGEGHHSSTGWETLLEGMLHSGWSVTATWPVRTELGNRMRGLDSNALASSVVLACRPRPSDAGVMDKRGLITALRAELPEALRRLQQGGIAPVDLAQAAIGPGMAVFSRYSRVSEPDGAVMRVRAALALINQVLDEVLAQQEGDFTADTRWCLEWFKTHGFDDGPFGDAETMSKAKNTSIAGLERAGVLWSRGGKVHLLSLDDLSAEYDPVTDDRVSEWEIVIHLAKRLQERGGEAAARLMAAAKAVVDLDAVRELAYLLFSIAEKRGWAETARLFNGLATSWTDLADASRNPAVTSAGVQGDLGFEWAEQAE